MHDKRIKKQNKPLAMIVGSEGQDGYYLSHLLLKKNYEVIGIGRDSIVRNLKVPLASINIINRNEVSELMNYFKPSEIYYLAAYHHPTEAEKNQNLFSEFKISQSVHVDGLLNFLDGMTCHCPSSRLFYAASSHVFGDPLQVPQTEETPFRPICLYGITKAQAVEICQFYRKNKDIFASVGILYNHESPRRNPHFVTRKIIQSAVKIKLGMMQSITLGDLNAKVDWGAAEDYVNAMHKILQIEDTGNFIISSGELHTLSEFINITFGILGIDGSNNINEDPSLICKARRNFPLVGDNNKLKSKTGWLPRFSFRDLIEHMVVSEMQLTG